MSQNGKKHKLKSIQDVISYYNLVIFDEKIWKEKRVWKVAEVTYSYHKESNVNETLFVHIGGMNLQDYMLADANQKKELLQQAKSQVENVINEKVILMQEALQKLQEEQFSQGSKPDMLEKEIFENALLEKLNLLEYCLMSLEFEAEKAGLDLEMNDEEIQKLEADIFEIDTKLFGGCIKDNQEEVVFAYEHIYGRYLVKRHLLSPDQENRLVFYLDKIRHFLPKHYQFIKKQKTPKIQGGYLKYNLQRSDYILAFNMLIDTFGTMHHIVKSDISAGSISDGPEGVYFPMNEKFNTITIERFFRLGMHEIETHSVTDHNSREILGNLRGANSTKKDEGTAILMEQLFIHGRNILKENNKGQLIIDVEKVTVSGYFVKILMGEILSNEDLQEFLELSEIIDPDIIPPAERYKRLKRNNRSGVQHKDTTYTRGLLQAIEEINLYIESDGKKGIKPEYLFIGKISFEETHKFRELKLSKQQQGKKIDDLLPIFVSDAVYYVIEKKLQGLEEHINAGDFVAHLQYKYPILKFINDLDTKVYFRKNSRVMGIANVLLQIISNKKVENIFENANDQQKRILEKIFQTQYQPLINDVHADLAFHRRNHQ